MMAVFGHAAVYGGRRLGVGEMRRLNLAQRVQGAYQARAAYRDKDGKTAYAEWATKYPDEAKLLLNAEVELHG